MKLALATVMATALAFTSAAAQQTAKFAKIDCSESRIVVPPSFTCFASNNVAGGISGQGLFKFWNAIGNVGSRVMYFYVAEAIDANGEIWATGTLADDIRLVSSEAKAATTISPLKQMAGADYVTFVGKSGQACAGFRKLGDARRTGYRWVQFGTICAPAGKALDDAEISAFITKAGFK